MPQGDNKNQVLGGTQQLDDTPLSFYDTYIQSKEDPQRNHYAISILGENIINKSCTVSAHQFMNEGILMILKLAARGIGVGTFVSQHFKKAILSTLIVSQPTVNICDFQCGLCDTTLSQVTTETLTSFYTLQTTPYLNNSTIVDFHVFLLEN